MTRRLEWSSNPMPVLKVDRTGAQASQMVQISMWQQKATLATTAAVGSEFLTKMAHSLTKEAKADGTFKIKIKSHDGKVFYDLLEVLDDTQMTVMTHFVGAAMLAGAPIGDDEEWADVEKDKAKIRKAYRELKPYFTSFNTQMFNATSDARSTAYAHANRKYPKNQMNPYLGLVGWHLITTGPSINNVRKRIDDIMERIRLAVDTPIERATDVAGYLDLINEVYLDYVSAGGKIDSANDAILPKVLRVLSDGEQVYARPDTKHWKKIGAIASAFKEQRDGGKSISWETVHATILTKYDELFDDTEVGSSGPTANGPAPHKTRAKFPMGVGFAGITTDD